VAKILPDVALNFLSFLHLADDIASEHAMKTILIVEDNDKNLKLARDVLQAKGYATLEAVNGLDGVALAHRPDLS